MIGKFKDKLINSKGNYEIVFEIDNYYSKINTETLIIDKKYKFEPKEIKSERSSQQNNFMWKCLELIAEKELNGRSDSEYVMDLYIKMLEKSGAKYEYLMGMECTIPELLKVFRAVKIVEYREYNDKKMCVLKCFYGSSKMNTKEMNNLIDTILDYAANIDLYIDKGEYYGN